MGDDDENSALRSLGPGGNLSKRSAANAWVCNSDNRREVLVGPFNSEVMQWHTMSFEFKWLDKGDCIITYTGDAVNASDAASPITYPPLHMHHIHISREVPHWWETHGDYHMDPKEGYKVSLPAGTCVVHDGSHVGVLAQVNDVRFMQSAGCTSAKQCLHATPYSWYLRVKFMLAPAVLPKPHALSRFHIYYPSDQYASQDLLQRYNVGNSTHVMFWQVTLPQSGDFLPPTTILHTHRARYGGYVLVKGNHTLQSLTGLPRECHRTGTCNSLAAVRRLVLEKAGNQTLCRDRPEISNYESFKETGDGYGGNFDRPGSMKCAPFSFTKGDVVTVFSFSKPVWAAHVNPFPQHTILFGQYRPVVENLSVSEMAVPSTHGVWVLGNSGFYKERIQRRWR